MKTIAAFLLSTSMILAHPMGNFSVSHYARIEPMASGARLTYALDLAEAPAFDLLRGWGISLRDTSAIAIKARAVSEAGQWLDNLVFMQNGQRVRPQIQSVSSQVNDGAGGMAVLRIQMDAHLDVTPGSLEYEDRNFPDKAGWKEIVIASGPGASITHSSHTSSDMTRALTYYPSDATPPQDLRASLTWIAADGQSPIQQHTSPGAALSQSAYGGNLVRGDFLSRLLSRQELSWTMIALGLLAAFGLGAMHALSPGHGKTIVAAYLVGSRGTAYHAMILGAMVTFTHTASVFALGLGVLFFQNYVQPERIIPTLGAVSGLSIVIIGAWLLYQRTRALALADAHAHHHHHHHSHDGHHHHAHGDHHHHHHHDGFVHTHSHDGIEHSHVIPDSKAGLGGLIALGVSGGLVPCPSALILMLSSIGIGRTALGLGMLVSFSAGLALVLMAVGIMVLYAKNHLPAQRAFRATPVFRLVPVLSALVVMILGVLMTLNSLGWVRPIAFLS